MSKIAIVEDDQPTRQALEAVVNLSAEHCCVCTCPTAEEALRILPQHRPEIVLMDIQLPQMSGIECVAHLKQLLPATLVIMVTVYEDPNRIFNALRAGASGYLLKRATSDEVLAAIHEVQHGGAPMSSAIARKVIHYFQKQPATTEETERLTSRECEILDLLAEGLLNKEIADRLGLHLKTVRYHLDNIYHRLHVRSRVEAVVKYRERGC